MKLFFVKKKTLYWLAAIILAVLVFTIAYFILI